VALTINKEVNYLRMFKPIGSYLAAALERLELGVNNLGEHLAADPTGTLPEPPPIQSLAVKASNGDVHAVITDNNPIQRGLHYFVEYSSEPAFLQPHVVHLGVSRSMSPIRLPAFDDKGNPQVFYFRAYSQYPGSHPGQKVLFGGTSAASVNPGGTTNMTLLPSTGSGTAAPTGQQGGSGFGKVLRRP